MIDARKPLLKPVFLCFTLRFVMMNTDAAHGTFDWPLAYEAEDLLRKFILAFLKKTNSPAT